jgi:glycosyltransferase involved in cell wall biosynthesis
MASGAPVVAGRAGSLPEITGSAAVLVNPLDVADIEGGIESAIENRGRLQAAGLAHAAKYTWEKTAKATFDVYRELA